MSPRAAITTILFVNGALFASWVSRIPAISQRVAASPGSLGLALLAPAVAAFITFPVMGRLLPGRSSRTFCRAAVVIMAAAVVLPGLARSVPALAAALLLIGVGNSMVDVAGNAQGLLIERDLRKPILSSIHAAFSFGGFAGAVLGGFAAALSATPLTHLTGAALVFGVTGLIASVWLLPEHESERARARESRQRQRRLPRRLLLIGLAAFFCLLGEGGAADWSAKLVHDDLGGSAAIGALAYAAFSVAMGVGRLLADGFWSRWGAPGLLRRSGILAAAGFAVGLAIGTAAGVTVGFIALGLGLAGGVPTLMRAGAEQPGVPVGAAVATVGSIGYLGFLAGPPLIGGIAQLTSLRAASIVLVAAGLVVAALAGSARRPRPEVADLAARPLQI